MTDEPTPRRVPSWLQAGPMEMDPLPNPVFGPTPELEERARLELLRMAEGAAAGPAPEEPTT